MTNMSLQRNQIVAHHNRKIAPRRSLDPRGTLPSNLRAWRAAPHAKRTIPWLAQGEPKSTAISQNPESTSKQGIRVGRLSPGAKNPTLYVKVEVGENSRFWSEI